jgi:hypothetical protein
MTSTGKTFKWMLWPQEGVFGASDEFIVEAFRVRLMGNMLDLSFEGTSPCSSAAASALAEKYVTSLGKRVVSPLALITEQEFLVRTTPPFGAMTTRSATREGRERIARAVREARNELLSAADETLRRCYEYFQDAREQINILDGKPAYEAYKALEVLEARFGSERNAIAVLGKVFKKAKRAANEPRHIPRKGLPQSRESASLESVELVRETIRAYERYLLLRVR